MTPYPSGHGDSGSSGAHPAEAGQDMPGGTVPGRPAASSAGPDEAERWAAVARIRDDYRDWVIIWVAGKGEFQARPLFRAPADAVTAGATTDELITSMAAFRTARRGDLRAR